MDLLRLFISTTLAALIALIISGYFHRREIMGLKGQIFALEWAESDAQYKITRLENYLKELEGESAKPHQENTEETGPDSEERRSPSYPEAATPASDPTEDG